MAKEENEKKKMEKAQELNEKYLNQVMPSSMQLNLAEINKCRVISNIFSGVVCGINGFGLPAGILFWVAWNVITSVLIYLRIASLGFEPNGDSKYFKDGKAAASTGLFSNLMTFMLFWVMFYNIVYVV